MATASGQSDLSGLWEGYVTKEDEPKPIKFNFALQLTFEGTQISGKSNVSLGGMYGVMELKGERMMGQFVRLSEMRIVDSVLDPGMEWCLKKMHLSLQQKGAAWVLEGIWEGKTSFGPCAPGKVYLKKSKPRA